MGKAGNGLNVVLVENDPDCREIFGDFLHLEGFGVTECEDMPAALVHLAEGAVPNVALVDLTLDQPGDAAVVIATVRAANPSVAVVVISGVSDIEDRCAALDVRHYLRKPFNLDALLDAIAAAADDGKADFTRQAAGGTA